MGLTGGRYSPPGQTPHGNARAGGDPPKARAAPAETRTPEPGVPFVQDVDFELHVGDVREVLASLPDESVHCVVTSPPYWGLRDYGTGAWDGGDPDCDHVAKRGTPAVATGLGYPSDGGPRRVAEGNTYNEGAFTAQFRDVCGKCGARRVDRQLGLEATPDLYVARMVEVFREVRRVLRGDGTCWVNLGDSYASGGAGWRPGNPDKNGGNSNRDGTPVSPGLKPKDLVGIPWRVAFALQADGWYLRADIIWAKPNPMPESVTDRPTKAHEYVFLLSKRPRYFFDQEAVREPHESTRWGGRYHTQNPNGKYTPDSDVRIAAASKARADRPDFDHYPHAGRNVRSVWEIATQPYPDAHFATFPEELARRCILAGTSERGVCPECGAPWEREVERGESDYARLKREHGHTWNDMDAAGLERGVIIREGEGGQTRKPNGTVPSLRAADTRHVGWRPTCGCGTGDVPEVQHDDVDAEPVRGAVPVLRPHPPVPSVVLDPFLGSGTVAHVARKHGRRSIGIDLNPAYAELAARRLSQLSLLA